MSRKGTSPSFGQLLYYINKGATKNVGAVLHNFKNQEDHTKKIEAEFLENFQHLSFRKNGVVLYHEILSFSVHDRAKLNSEIIEDLGREYLQLRAPEALAYAKPHFESDTVHLHVVISSNLIGSKKKLRLSKKEFAGVKREIERIQKERYPELCNSLVMDKEVKKKRRKTRREGERERRMKGEGRIDLNEKERTANALKDCLLASSSQDDFTAKLKQAGFNFYVRGKTLGVQNIETGKRHRIKTLGLMKDYEEAEEIWAKVPERITEVKEIERSRVSRRFREFGFKKDILEVLEAGKKFDPNESVLVRKRWEELERVARLQRELRRSVLDRWERSL